jgi:hypothetical protein
MLAIEEDMNNLRGEIARLEATRDKRKGEYDIQVHCPQKYCKFCYGKLWALGATL